MITIEGLGGKGSVWCAVRFAPGMPTGINSVDAAAKDYNEILSAAPCEMLLPPVGPATLWYECDRSPYGPRLTKVDVGTLFDVHKSPYTPNPCEHSTIIGSLVATGSDFMQIPKFGYMYTFALSRKYYTPTGAVATYHQGQPATSGSPRKAVNRYGELVSADPYGSTYNYYAMLTDFASPIGSSNPLYNNGARSGMWLSTRVDGNEIPSLAANYKLKTECHHVSARVWVERKWLCCHQNNSYIPAKPLGYDGLGYLFGQTFRERTITLRSIQSTHATFFQGKFECVETVQYYGRTSGLVAPESGTMTFTYSFTRPIVAMLPGLTVKGSFDSNSVNNYCEFAKERAKVLYKCNDAKTARSNAIAAAPGLDSNWIENLSQIKGTADVLLPLVDGWKAVKNHDIAAGKRALISAYLAYMYMVRPTISDIKDVSKHIGTVSQSIASKRFSNERRRGRLLMTSPVCDVTADLAYYCTLNLQLKDNSFALLGNALEKLGLNPSAANIWDLLPFSFVADWFLHIGPILSNLDAFINARVLRNVESRVETFKVLWPLTTQDLKEIIGTKFSVSLPLKYSWYDRRILTGVGSFDPFAGQSLNGLSVSQMTQGSALLSLYQKR